MAHLAMRLQTKFLQHGQAVILVDPGIRDARTGRVDLVTDELVMQTGSPRGWSAYQQKNVTRSEMCRTSDRSQTCLPTMLYAPVSVMYCSLSWMHARFFAVSYPITRGWLAFTPGTWTNASSLRSSVLEDVHQSYTQNMRFSFGISSSVTPEAIATSASGVWPTSSWGSYGLSCQLVPLN